MGKHVRGPLQRPLLKSAGIPRLFKPRLLLLATLLCAWTPKDGPTPVSGKFPHKSLPKITKFKGPPIPSLLIGSEDPIGLGGPTGPLLPDMGDGDMGVLLALRNPELMEPDSEILPEPRKKKNCGMPSVAARSLIGPSLKRSYFATTPKEVEEKQQEEAEILKAGSEMKKRNDLADGPLPWTCETKYEWIDMGADHYPRFVRTAECKSRICVNGFFHCRPRSYKTKVLRRLTGAESTSCEEDDVSLPESLRTSWRFITVNINLCCDCTGRRPGPEV